MMPMVKGAPTRPVLRYHGGKWRLAPWVISHFPQHGIYTEAFGGGASVLLRKPRVTGEVYNDLDGEIVNLFRVLRNPSQARELERLLRLTPFAREEFDGAYLTDGDPIEQARRTLIKSYMGFGADGITNTFGTGFRANATRSYGTPAGDWSSYPGAIAAITARLSGITIENRPAIEVLRQHDSPATLHYVDPPYPHVTRTRPTHHCYRFEMSDDDHRELGAVLRSLKGMIVLSGYPCDLCDQELYPDWTRFERKAHGDGATIRTEVAWLNSAAVEHQQRQLPL